MKIPKLQTQEFKNAIASPRKCLLLLFFSLLYFFNANSQIVLQLNPSNYNGYNISCFGGTNGAIDLTITGGTPPYVVIWSNSASTEDISGLPAGYYRVTVDDTDSLTSPELAEIMLTEPRKLTLSVNAYKYPNGFNISLYESCNGSITTTVSDGVAPYSWAWNDGNSAQNRSSLCAANYTIAVTDANGCIEKNLNVLLIQPDRSDWQMSGNNGIDPAVNFIGTSDSTDIVFKTNNLERARIKSSGEFRIEKIVTDRIVSSNDSLISFGNNTLYIYHKAQTIHGNPSNTAVPNNGTGIPNKGTGIGYRTVPQGTWSVSLGHDVITRGPNGFAFGYKLRTGDLVSNAMVIGTGFVSSPYNSDNLLNDIENSLMIGFNSRNPTLFIAPNSSTNENLTGAVGINTTFIPADYKLAVNGKIIATEVLVKDPGTNFSNWPPDYVFYEGYSLMSLPELKIFIYKNCHLPEVPSASQIEEEGLKVYEMQLVLLKKVEELTLHAIQQHEEIDALKQQIRELKSAK